MISWATVGQGGHGHFNEKDPADVLKLFQDRGFRFMVEETRQARSVCQFDHLQKNFSVFCRV
jgi:hypothetical protein